MKAETFYPKVREALEQPAEERYRRMRALHEQIRAEYREAVRSIGPQRAAETSSDGRSVAQVVGHIAEWDRWMVLGAGELLAGAKAPQMMRLQGYLDPDGQVQSFNSIGEFNAVMAHKQASLPWEEIQALALDMSERLHRLFTQPGLLDAAVLERGAPDEMRFSDGAAISVPVGWVLWHITLEHEGVEHAPDLGIG